MLYFLFSPYVLSIHIRSTQLKHHKSAAAKTPHLCPDIAEEIFYSFCVCEELYSNVFTYESINILPAKPYKFLVSLALKVDAIKVLLG